MGKTDYLENALLNHVLRNTPYTSPTTVYVGLLSAAPSDSTPGTEFSGNAYARKAVTFGAPGAVGTGSAGTVSNSAEVQFDTATPNGWGTATHFGIYDAASGGNLLRWAALTGGPKTIAANDAPRFPIGSLVCTED